MVAVISGSGLGLFNSSFNTLGKNGVHGSANFGQNQLQNYVNIADGNLIIRQLDQNLSAIGKDIKSIQTYNSKGVLSGDTQWGGEWSRRLSLVGDLNIAGSKILITAEDGHQITFKYSSANTYVSTEGDGAYDKLSISGNTWIITDGKTLATEVYEYNPSLKTGRLVAVKDSNGTNLAYRYDALDRLVSIEDSNSISLNELIYNYDGNSNRIKRIDTKANGITNQNVYYEYDNLNRLSKVITDLTPSDNTIADQKVYSTNYSYELNSSRIASITQSDGTSVQFSYELDSISNSYRVKTVRDSEGLTTFTYTTNKTTVENSLKEIFEYSYDANQQLISIKNANAEVSSFSYDSQGNVISMVDNEGIKLTYRYDSNGNLIEEYNHLGKAVKYSYINNSQLATITEFNDLATKDANGNWILPTGDSSNTNSVYDSAMRLRFVISAEGGVVEYSYNSQGQLITKSNYQNKYAVASGVVFATLETWSKKNARTQLSSYEYDVLGNLKREINYSSINKTVDAAGLVNNQGVFEDATQLIDYVYDPRGLLLQKIIRHGVDRETAAATAAQEIQSFTYDGLGRVLTEMSAAGTRIYSYAAGKITVINAANLVTTQSFDSYGRLLNIVQSTTNHPSRTTSYIYDEAGRLVYSKQPTGNEQFNFYDKKGRLVGVTDSSGLLIEYIYNKNDLHTKEIRYANAVNSTGWLVNNSVAKKRVEEIRPAVNSFDRVIEKSYDISSQLKSIKQANGTLIEYTYDNFGNVIQTKTGDRISRYFYNKDNQQVGALDAEGYLTETIYNAVGQKVQVNRYSKLTIESLRAAGTLAQLKPTGSDNVTRSTLFFYNTQNKLIGSIDEKNFITAYIYDEKNNTVTTRQYSAAATTTANMNTVWADFIAVIPAMNSYQESIKYYDNQGRLTKLSDTRQGITTYVYDDAGRVITEILATGSANERRIFTRYNAFDDVTHMLAGEVTLDIKSGMTAAQIDQVYEQYAIKSYYDAAGRKTQVLNAAGQLTTFYYDKSGRLTHSINAEGNVVETSYTLFGEIKTTTQYINSLSKTDAKVTDLAGSSIPAIFNNTVGVGKRLKGGELTTTLANLITAIKNASKDKIEKFEYDKLGNISRKIDADLKEVEYLYNQYGELETEKRQITLDGTKKEVQNTYNYSKRGEIKSIILDSKGIKNTNIKEYDAYGRIIKEIDANGNITTFDHTQDQGRSIQVKSANNSLTKTTYDAWNRVLTVNNNNNINSYTYDDKARTLTIKSPEGFETITRYNEFGDVVDIVESNNGKKSYLYNKDGKKIKEIDALGASDYYFYDKNTGLLKEKISASGLKTQYVYDFANRIQSQIIIVSANEKIETQYVYDGAGQCLKVIEAYGSVNQKTTQYNYDKTGRLLSIITRNNSGLTESYKAYSYDESGNQILFNDSGLIFSYTYDALGRRISETKDPENLKLKTEYRYDNNGNLTRKIDPSGNSTWYIYDSKNNLTYSIDSLGGVVNSIYDLNGRVVSKYYYNIFQDVTSWVDKDIVNSSDIKLNKSSAILNRFVYNKDGLEIFKVDGEGNVVEKQYNEMGKISNIISYDKKIQISDEILIDSEVRSALKAKDSSSKIESYYYDILGRVVYTINPLDYIVRNDYDLFGNLISIIKFRDKNSISRSTTQSQLDLLYKAGNIPAHSKIIMYYNSFGKKIYEINQVGGVIRYTYNEFGSISSKKELSLDSSSLMDLLRSKDVNGNFISPRPVESVENYDLALKLINNTQFKEENYYYDSVNKLVFQIDALGYLTQYIYAGDFVNTIVKYVDQNLVERNISSDQLRVKVSQLIREKEFTGVSYVRDFLGRVLFEVNGMKSPSDFSNLIYYQYDAIGNISSKKNIALNFNQILDLLRKKDENDNFITERPAETIDSILKGIALVPNNLFQEKKYYYNKLGRISYEVNELDYVTNYMYDAFGNKISKKESILKADNILDLIRVKDSSGNFIVSRPEFSTENFDKAFKLVNSTNYRETNSYYDKNGQLNYIIDSLGYIKRFSYDAYGNLIDTVLFKNVTINRGLTLSQLDSVYRTATILPEYVITQYIYDNLNRRIKEIDGEGFSIETGYDAFNNIVWVKDKLGNKGYFIYDALNRNTIKIDPEGYITYYTYDAFGNQINERKFLSPISGIDKILDSKGIYTGVKFLSSNTDIPPINQPYLSYGVTYTEVNYQYDKLNRKTKITDNLGYYEEYTYNNGLAQPATYRNKLGGVYSYTYDKMGHLIQEILPELSNGKPIINIYKYDAFGNKIKMIEAQGLPEQRTSTYEYDSLNRLISKIAESVSTTQLKVTDSSKPYLKNKAVIADNIPRESYQYDAYGNQIEKIDANGAKTLTYFDKNDRKIAEINALGLLTKFEYNVSGQVTKIQSYETPINVPTSPGGAVPNTPSGNVRVIQYSYDKLGRQISKITPDVYTYEYDLQGQGALVKKTTIEKTFYDGNGNIIRIEDAKGNTSFYYYDKIGRKILTVDNEKYITQWIYGYNSSTEINSQTEIKYANKLIQDITSSNEVEQVKALIVIDTANDRKTINTYDKKGRITQTEILNVKYSDGSTIKMASSTISYAYNGLDQVLTKIDSTGTVSTSYDKLGREILRTFGEYKDSNNITVKQRISSVYNGLGLLSSSAILGTNDAITTDDRVTQYSYDKLGRLITELDVNLNHAVNYAYDLAGNQTWISTDRKTNTSVVKTDETLIEYNLLGKEITRRVNEGSRSSSESTAISWKTLEERETRYNAFGEITGKRLVKFDSSTKSTDQWHEVTEYNNQGKVWKSNANNGVTRYYLYDSNGNATLQLDSTGSSGINAKTPDQLKDLTAVTYTETIYDKRNQVISVRQPKFSQESLDTTLNIFGQTISRTSDRSTVTLTDSTNKLKFDADTQKFNIQSNPLAKRLILKYWPKDSVATGDKTLIVDMQSGITAGAFILDVSAIKPNVEFNYIYSSSDIDGTVYETGVGVLKRIVNTVDIFTGGTVTADPEAKLNDIVGTTMSSVSVDIFNDYKLPITVIGNKVQKITGRKDTYHPNGQLKGAFINYDEGINVKMIQLALPSSLKGFGEGNFEVELTIDGQVYKKSVAENSSVLEIALDNNTDKFLSGKNYNIKIYKRTSTISTELVMNTTNKITDKLALSYSGLSYWSELPSIYYSKIGDEFEFEQQMVNQDGILNNYNHLMLKNTPAETSRIEFRYKLQGTSQWSMLTDNTTLYKNIKDWYQIDLGNLEINELYDYQYITYNSRNDILGGGEGVINTKNNLANVIQKKLSAGKLSGIYTDKKEFINSKYDSVIGVNISNNYKVATILNMMSSFSIEDYPSNYFKLRYEFDNNILNQYVGNEFFFLIEDTQGRGFKKQISFQKNSESNNSIVFIDFSYNELDILMPEYIRRDVGKTIDSQFKITLVNKINQSFVEIASGVQTVSKRDYNAGPRGPRKSVSIDGGLLFKSGKIITLTNQYPETSDTVFYVRESGSNQPYTEIFAIPLKDIYGAVIPGVFECTLNDNIDLTKKHDFQYFSLSGKNILNRQQGTLEFKDSKIKINVSPVNYGGDGFIIFSAKDVIFVNQFKSTTNTIQLKVRKLGEEKWSSISISRVDFLSKLGFSWYFSNLNREGEYEFQLSSLEEVDVGFFGRLRLGEQPEVLSYISKSFFQNKVTFSGQPNGSNKITVKYGTHPNQLDKTSVLLIGADGKAILDITEISEQNLFGSTTVYYSYETTDVNSKVLNRANGYINVGLAAGTGQHTNQINDSWIDFQPAQNYGTKMEVYYRKRQVDKNGNFVSDLVNSDLSSDAYWGDKAQFEKVVLSRTNGLYRWNINNLVPQAGFENYEYFYQLYDQNNKFISFVPGKITVDNLGNGSIEQTKWVINGSGSNQNQIIRQQNYNAFGEVINEIDGNGNIITFSYNNLGKLTEKKLPNVNIRKADGTVAQGNPTLEYAYDLAGRLVSTKDANGNITKQTYLNGHNLETGDWLISNEIHADLGQVISSYDVFGNLKVRTNELGVKTAYDYDLNGYLVKTTRAARSINSIGAKAISDTSGVQNALVDIYGYDELGNRIITTDALKNSITTEYDALGRIIENKTAEGAITKIDYIYDSSILNVNGSKGGIKRTETDGLGKKIIDDFDYYGRTIKHTDRGGHVFDYTYNAGGWLTRQTNSQGQSIGYSYYNNGLIKEIRDSSLNLSTVYRYDNNGNRIEERYQELNAKIGEPRIFQNALTTYDSLNRKIRVQDQAFNIHYEYDANGNIIHMLANYRDAVNAAPKIQDFWYSYDNMNRFTVSMGILNSTTKIVERGNTGVALSYDVLGQRLSADYGKDALNSTKAHKERYTYTTDGFLETIKNADYGTNGLLGTEYTLSSRHIDELGRVVEYEDYNENSNSIYQTTKNIYNKDDQLISQQKEGGSGAGTTVYSYLADKVTLDKTVMTPNSGSAQTTQFTYDWWDSAKQKNIKVTVGNLVGETTFSYDVNGHVSGFVDDKNAQNKRTATYVNNSQGMVLQRNELINGSVNRYRNFYYINGQRVGDVSNDGPSREDYVQSLQNSRGTPTQAKDFKPISSADFDQNFEPINAQYPSAAPTSYVVNNGDTLQSIALSVWGDASMWYMIADVNGLSPSDKLTAGQVLTIPNKVTNIHNNSETLRPYSPGEAIGDTQPTIPSPPPPPKPKKKCGGIAQIVMIVVAIVVTIYTAGAASAAFGALAAGGGIGGAAAAAGTAIASGSAFGIGGAALAGSTGLIGISAAAVGAAAGSAASQLAGKAMGVVDSFSWSQVGVSALTAGATAGVGAGIGQLATKGYSWAQTASNAINAVNNGTASWTQAAGVGAYAGAVGYGSNYIANQVFGNNQSFSWAGLGSSIVGSMAGAGLGKSGAFNGFGKLASPYAYSVAGASAAATIEDKWFGGVRPDYLNVSMAAIANTVGRQFGENAQSWFANGTTKTVSIYDENVFSFLPTEYSSQQSMYGDASRLNGSLPDTIQLPTIVSSASNSEDIDDFEGMHLEIEKEAPRDLNIASALDGVNSFFNNRIAAIKEWGNASVPFQYSWATPKINTGNSRLDKYYFQPVNDLVNTVANVGWNALKFAGNTATIMGNSPTAALSVLTGDYDESQRTYDALLFSNPATGSIAGGARAGLGYIRDVREFNKVATVGRAIGSSQRGSASIGLLNDIPVGSTTGEVLTASAPASPIKALYPSTASTQIKAPFVSTTSRTLHFDNIDTFNRAANNPIPNTSYKHGGVTWTTDSQARISMIEGEVSLKNHGRYVTSGEPQQATFGKGWAFEDVAFHLIGNQFDGPTNGLNLVPGSGRSIILSDGTKLKNLNLSRYKTDFENPVAEIYKQTGKNVPVKIEAIYDSNTIRPEGFVTKYQKADGTWIRVQFENRAGG